MSQWTALSFEPPRYGNPWPIARWTVPSIFSSKSVFRMWLWMPGIAADPELAEPARALVGVEHAEQELLVGRRARLDDPAALEAEADVPDLVVQVARRILRVG